MIHKSKGLTLEQDTIDIGNRERKGFIFTTISRVKFVDVLHISPFEHYAKMENSTYVTLRMK